MAKPKEILLNIELSLTKERVCLGKNIDLRISLKKQRKNLKNKAKIVSLLEYKKIVNELYSVEKNILEINKKIDELLIQYEKNKENQKP